MSHAEWQRGESDAFIGRRTRLSRYLVCSMQGYFPVLVRTGPQSLAAVFRTGGPHLGATGTLSVATSADGGKCWSDPRQVTSRWDDSRNPSLGVNADGELVLAFWKARLHAYQDDPTTGTRWAGTTENDRWATVPALFHTRRAGATWTEPEPYSSTLLSLASPYGRMLTAPDGALLMPVYGRARAPLPGKEDTSILLRSRDGGRTWGEETLVTHGYNETSYALVPNGDLVAAARSDDGHVAVLRSSDIGRTWTEPVQLTRPGEHPADLTLLESGRLLMTFGRRIRPLGCGALFSDDGGVSWRTDEEVLLAGDGGESFDLGYPSTVQLADGTIVTLLYYAAGSDMAARHWGTASCQAIHYREEDLAR